MRDPGFIKSYDAEAAISQYRIVKPGTDEKEVAQASANTDALLGVVELAASAGERVDVVRSGFAEVEYGGDVTRGDFLTSDANGKAVKLTDAMLESGACWSLGVAEVDGASGDIGSVYINPQKVSKFDAVDSSAAELNTLNGAPAGATITVGAENAGTGVINVAIQLKDANGDDLAVRGAVQAYLSDDANGDSVVGTAHDGAVAIGTDGLMLPVVAKKHFVLVSESDGDIDINITESGAKTAYLILVLPNGKLVASEAITHASE